MLLFNYAASKMTEIISANGVNQLTESFSSARPLAFLAWFDQ